MEKDGWIFAHNALRSEMKLVREALEEILRRDKGVKEWEIQAIKTASSAHLEHMKWHAENEDVNIIPELKKRYKFPVRYEPFCVSHDVYLTRRLCTLLTRNVPVVRYKRRGIANFFLIQLKR